jgi:tetratricopeptide (TPR) repeat protein
VKQLKLPGGQESQGVTKLYLTYRERAAHEIRRVLEQLTGGRYDRGIPGAELLTTLFQVQDRRRATKWNRRLEEAFEAHRAGDLEGALKICEEILRQAPTFPQRTRMFPLLRQKADALALRGDVRAASALLERAALLLPERPEGPERRMARADAAYLAALDLEAEGRRGDAILQHERALAIQPGHLGSRVALMHLAPTPRPEPLFLWALLLLAALGAPALVWLVSFLARLRQPQGA